MEKIGKFGLILLVLATVLVAHGETDKAARAIENETLQVHNGTICGSWVMDTAIGAAYLAVEEWNTSIETGRILTPVGSGYKVGPSKAGIDGTAGIYFVDPTATNVSCRKLNES